MVASRRLWSDLWGTTRSSAFPGERSTAEVERGVQMDPREIGEIACQLVVRGTLVEIGGLRAGPESEPQSSSAPSLPPPPPRAPRPAPDTRSPPARVRRQSEARGNKRG